MIKAKADDKALVVNMLSKAFDENQSVNYIVLQDNNRKKRIDALMEYSFDVCLLFGEVFLSDDRKGCALVLYPEKKRTTFRSIGLDLKLVFNGIGFKNVIKALKRETKIKGIRPDIPMTYLWFIGVNPEYQHFGLGKRLMEEVIIKSKSENRKIFLETSTLENLPWYRKFGFEIYDELTFNYTLFFLKR